MWLGNSEMCVIVVKSILGCAPYGFIIRRGTDPYFWLLTLVDNCLFEAIVISASQNKAEPCPFLSHLCPNARIREFHFCYHNFDLGAIGWDVLCVSSEISRPFIDDLVLANVSFHVRTKNPSNSNFALRWLSEYFISDSHMLDVSSCQILHLWPRGLCEFPCFCFYPFAWNCIFSFTQNGRWEADFHLQDFCV